MSGRMSRNKGKRREYEIRDVFRTWGYECDRVPSSGASQGFKGDLRVRKNRHEFLVEVKARANDFSTIYGLIGVNHTVIILPNHGYPAFLGYTAVTISYHDPFSPPETPWETITASVSNQKKLNTLFKLKGNECQLLVVQDDRKKPLFLKFYGGPHFTKES